MVNVTKHAYKPCFFYEKNRIHFSFISKKGPQKYCDLTGLILTLKVHNA